MGREEDIFGDVEVFSGESTDAMAAPPSLQAGLTPMSAMTTVERARAIAEVQAAMVIARMSPRDETLAYSKLMKACKRLSFAESAMYAYKRGSTLIEDGSIRLAETAARSWGNMTYGLRETNRSAGSSEIEAFAWDLETNTRVTRSFTVRHIREKQSGDVKLTSERDIYELGANMGQRRVRACIFELIPGDIVEAAKAQCKKTVAAGDGSSPFEDRVRDMVLAFDEQFKVSQAMIEDFIGHKIDAMVPAEFTRLKQVYRSLRDGLSKREEFFRLSSTAPSTDDEGGHAQKQRPKGPHPSGESGTSGAEDEESPFYDDMDADAEPPPIEEQAQEEGGGALSPLEKEKKRLKQIMVGEKGYGERDFVSFCKYLYGSLPGNQRMTHVRLRGVCDGLEKSDLQIQAWQDWQKRQQAAGPSQKDIQTGVITEHPQDHTSWPQCPKIDGNFRPPAYCEGPCEEVATCEEYATYLRKTGQEDVADEFLSEQRAAIGRTP